MEKLKPEQLQYICRSQFDTGIPMFRNPYRSPEQIERAIPTLRRLMLERDVPKDEHMAVLRVLPGRFTAPEELSFYLGFKDVLIREEDSIGQTSAVQTTTREISTEDFINRHLTGTPSRFLLNSYILLSHPSVLVSYDEVEKNKGIYGVWDKKFPSKKCIESVPDNVLYGRYGEMNPAEVMEYFLEMLTKRQVKLPDDVRKDLINRLE